MNIGTNVYLRKVVSQDQSEFLQLMRASAEMHRPWITPPPHHKCFATTCSASAAAIMKAMRSAAQTMTALLESSISITLCVAPSRMRHWAITLASPIKVTATCSRGWNNCSDWRSRPWAASAGSQHTANNLRSKGSGGKLRFDFEGLSKNFLYIDGEWRDHERWSVFADRDTLRP